MIDTRIGKNTIQFSWHDKLNYFKGNNLSVTYDVDISQTPRHLANFMFGIIMAGLISFNRIPVEFDELTEGELEAINSLVRLNYLSKGCSGRPRGYDKFMPLGEPPKVKSKKLVVGTPPRNSGPVLCANGMGKDGLNVLSLVRELGFDMRCFTVYGQLSEKVWNEHTSTMNKLYALKNIQSNIIKTNFFARRSKILGTYCYYLALPLAHHYGSEAILSGTQIHVSKTSLKDNVPYCPGESIFGFNYATKATGINFSSPTRPISEYGAQKLLAERYPELLNYQRSCIYSTPWCNRCSKCRRTALYLELLGKEYGTLGLKYAKKEDFSFLSEYYSGVFENDILALKMRRHYGGVIETDILALNMREKKKYGEWLVKANETVYPLIWKGKEISSILEEHFEAYSYDPGPDGFGYTCVPSRWREWMEKGFTDSPKR